MASVQIKDDEYTAAQDTNLGLCLTCKEFTRDGVEPDAENYQCPKCEGLTVMGAEQALLSGEIEIVA